MTDHLDAVVDSDAVVDVTRHGSIGAAFAATAVRCRQQPAVLTACGEVTYGALAGLAGGVAARLGATSATGATTVAPRVGLLLDHGVDMVAAILGALAAGWCYVPLDPTYPVPRLRQMAALAGTRTVLAHPDHRELAAVVVDHLTGDGSGHAVEPIDISTVPPAPLVCAPVDPGQPAYILFTSGSTGTPKGVTHSHRSVLHGIANHVTNLGISAADRLSLVTSFSYDMSVSDLYGAVLSGAAVVPVDLRTHGLAYLADTVSGQGVTIYHSTPTVFRYLLDLWRDRHGPTARLSTVRLVLLGGEPVNHDDLRLARTHLATNCRFVNGYGATEASFSVQLHVPPQAPPPGDGDGDGKVLPIGTPLAGYEIVLLDEAGTALPVGSAGPGELAVRSDHLALGYWGDPERTRERFVEDGRLYRTGDIVRWNDAGQLVYLGRADRQVKVDGHRVELGEVEAHAAALPEVARAVAVTRVDPDLGFRIQLYVQPVRGVVLDPSQVRRRLADTAPAYLLPHQVVVVAGFPLTTSGKVDIAALPAVPAATGPVPLTELPVGEREQLVAKAWCEVLDLPAVGRLVSFFDAGGSSLLLARLQYRLATLAGVDIPLVRLLEHPTVAAMAAHLGHATADARLGHATSTGDGPDDGAGPGGRAGAASDPLAAAAARMARRRRTRQAAPDGEEHPGER
jgi:amino acid adenylation domain-containing protein